MIGESLMVCPILYDNTDIAEPYFPKGGWNDIITGYKI